MLFLIVTTVERLMPASGAWGVDLPLLGPAGFCCCREEDAWALLSCSGPFLALPLPLERGAASSTTWPSSSSLISPSSRSLRFGAGTFLASDNLAASLNAVTLDVGAVRMGAAWEDLPGSSDGAVNAGFGGRECVARGEEEDGC